MLRASLTLIFCSASGQAWNLVFRPHTRFWHSSVAEQSPCTRGFERSWILSDLFVPGPRPAEPCTVSLCTGHIQQHGARRICNMEKVSFLSGRLWV